MLTLTGTPRTESGKRSNERLSRDGRLPAIVYGPKQAATSFTLPLLEFKRVLKVAGESSIVDLQGLEKPLQVLIHAVDVDPVTGTPRHVDFYAIEKGAKVEIAVPLSFIGESTAVKAGLSLVKVMHELEIEAAPADLPHEIEVDITALNAEGDQIHVSDLKIPHGVTVKVEMEEVVALIQAVEEEPEEETAAPDMDAIEVEQKGKSEDGEEEAAAE